MNDQNQHVLNSVCPTHVEPDCHYLELDDSVTMCLELLSRVLPRLLLNHPHWRLSPQSLLLAIIVQQQWGE